jgi:hypothetical protein
MNNEFEIVHLAGERFEESTKAAIRFRSLKNQSKGCDVTIQLKWKKNTITLDAVVKLNVNAAIIGQIRDQLLQCKNPPVIVTGYVTPGIAEILHNTHINYIDAAGNAFINELPLFICIRGKKPEALPITRKRLYQSSGLKIIFALLCNPTLEMEDYRTIAAMSQAALGSVGWVMRDLKQSGYLITISKKIRKLVNKEDLLNNWVANYHEHLKPKLVLGHYAALNENWWKTVQLKEDALWGSEMAAKNITNYLKPQVYSLYVKNFRNSFLFENKLHRSSEGNIEISKQFWNFSNKWSFKNTVPPLLVYADLIASQSDRNSETARIIYEQEITGLVS